MSDILSLLSVLHPHLSATLLRQFCQVVFGLLAMTGRVSMRNIARWTSKGGSYRTIQRFLNTVLPRFVGCSLERIFVRGLSPCGRRNHRLKIRGFNLWFVSMERSPVWRFSLCPWSVSNRCSYPMLMEQIVKPASSSNPCSQTSHCQTSMPKRKGRPKGSRNRNKTEVQRHAEASANADQGVAETY